jgi:LacI family transcriptional regulator
MTEPETRQKKPVRNRKSHLATLSDVAKLAGVSPMTVSRVVNGEVNVSAATRDLVNAAIASLNYVPNQTARRLAGSRPIRIGFLFNNPNTGPLTEFLIGLLNQASLHHVELLIEKCSPENQEESAARDLIANGVDGIILRPPLCDSVKLIDLIAKSSTPAVLVACGQPDKRVSAVSIDDYQAALEMTRHLLALGHRHLGFIIGNPGQTASARRLEGFRAALAQAGIAAYSESVVQGMFTYRSGLEAAETLLHQTPRPTAIFASNDDMAAATVAIAHRMGLDVPGDLTVAGFDDTALAMTIWPELTTVRQPIAAMAEAATSLLVRQIRARRNENPEPPEHVVMDFTLIRRQSDAAPRLRPPMEIPPDKA